MSQETSKEVTKELTKEEQADYIVIYEFLRTVDPTIAGFKVAAVDNATHNWVCVVTYNNGETGVIKGRDNKVLTMQGGSYYDLIPKEEMICRMETDPDFERKNWFEEQRD